MLQPLPELSAPRPFVLETAEPPREPLAVGTAILAQSTAPPDRIAPFRGYPAWEPPPSARTPRYENVETFVKNRGLAVLGQVGNTIIVTNGVNTALSFNRVDHPAQARRDLNETLAWLSGSPVGRSLLASLDEPGAPKVLFINQYGSNGAFTPAQNYDTARTAANELKMAPDGKFRANFHLIEWNPRAAQAVVRPQDVANFDAPQVVGHLPPAVILGHELGHLKGFLDDRAAYDRRLNLHEAGGPAEEMYVLRNYEHPLVRAFVLDGRRPPIRESYFQGRGLEPVGGPMQMRR